MDRTRGELMKSKFLLMAGALVVVVVLLLLFISFGEEKLSYRTVVITNNKIESRFSVTSDKDGFMGTYFGTENSIRLSNGPHKLSVVASGYDSIIIDLAEGVSGTKLDFKKEQAKEQASKMIGSSANIERAEYFGENTWMVANVNHSSVVADAEIVISKKVGDKWTPVSQGSAIDVEYLTSIGAPLDLIKYVEGL